MKKLLLLLLCSPLFVWGQFSVGNDQTICLGDTAQIIAALSGPGTSGCNGSIDSLSSLIEIGHYFYDSKYLHLKNPN